MSNTGCMILFVVPAVFALIGLRAGKSNMPFAALAGIMWICLCPYFWGDGGWTGTGLRFILGWMSFAAGFACLFSLMWLRADLKKTIPNMADNLAGEQLKTAQADNAARATAEGRKDFQESWEEERGLSTRKSRRAKRTSAATKADLEREGRAA